MIEIELSEDQLLLLGERIQTDFDLGEHLNGDILQVQPEEAMTLIEDLRDDFNRAESLYEGTMEELIEGIHNLAEEYEADGYEELVELVNGEEET